MSRRATRAIPLSDYIASMTAEAVPFEHLDAAEIMRRWPQWRLSDEHHGLFQADGGLADPNRANAAHQRLARAHGATLLGNAPVTALRDPGSGVIEVTTADGTTHRAGHVVLAADAWTNELLASFGRRLPLTITKEQVTYYACPRPEDFAPDRFPVWIWMDEPCFYGFPTYGEPGPKAAQDVGGRETTPAERTFDVDLDAHARVDSFLRAHLPGALGPDLYTKTCLYTLHPGPGLRPRPRARGSERAGRPRRRPRLQVRLAVRPDPGRARRRRLDPVGGRHRRLPDRPADPAPRRPADELHGLSSADPHRGAWSATLGAAIDRVRRAVPQCGPRGSVGVHRRWIGRASGGGTTNAPDHGGAAHPTRALRPDLPSRSCCPRRCRSPRSSTTTPCGWARPRRWTRRTRTRPRSSRATRRSS